VEYVMIFLISMIIGAGVVALGTWVGTKIGKNL
jgi:hypothetical protein